MTEEADLALYAGVGLLGYGLEGVIGAGLALIFVSGVIVFFSSMAPEEV